MTDPTDTEQTALVDRIRENYGQIARQVLDDTATGCCGSPHDDPITRDLYTSDESSVLPSAATAASLGCGNPTALIDLHDSDVVLDLGSGGGVDVLLSARRVAPSGFAYGLDMTDEMLDKSRSTAESMGLDHVEFRSGLAEKIPVPDGQADVVISNGVFNLCADKKSVFEEVMRVLRPGGRLQFADIANGNEVPEEAVRDIDLWTA